MKIHKALGWYSFDKAAQRLSVTLGEPVSFADVIQLVIEEQIPIHWHLRGQKAQQTIPDNNFLGSTKHQFKHEPEKTKILDGFYRLNLNTNPSVRELLSSIILGKKDGNCSRKMGDRGR